MKHGKKWLICLLVLVLTVSCLCVPAMAADGESISALKVSAPRYMNVGDNVAVMINAQVGNLIADGKLTVRYDSDVLTYQSAEVSTTWANHADVVLSDNASSGKVVLAFAGTTAAQQGTIIMLSFRAKTAGEATVTLAGEEAGDYITGLDTASGAYTLASEVTITVIGEGGSDDDKPTIPTPVEPPVRPSGSGDDAICDGGSSCPSRNFTDVAVNTVYHEGIDFMVENGYMNGVSATSFGPKTNMNRGMLVTILYRMAGEPAVSGSCPFTDVKTTDYFYDPVRWALENKITEGVSATSFDPNGLLTREQIAAFLYRYAEFAGYDTAKSASLSQYQDANQVSSWAQEAMEWAVGSGIINGVSATELKPGNNATREQIAVMVWRLVTANQG